LSTIIICILSVIILLLIIYIAVTKSRTKRQVDELTDYLTKVQDRGTLPEVGGQAEGSLRILQSEIYKVATQLQESYADETEKNRYLSDMLSDISHQIRTPLTAITLMTDLLKKGGLSEAEEKRCIYNIDKQAEHIITLVRSLLAIAQLDAGVLELKSESVTARELTADVLSPLELMAEVKEVSLESDVPEDMMLTCDRQWTREALTNILKNCLEHTDEGGCVSIAMSYT